MFVDYLSYNLQCKNNSKQRFNINKLKTNRLHKISLYSSDTSKYKATSYEFTIYDNKTYTIHKMVKYSSMKNTTKIKTVQKSFSEYVKCHIGYILCISNLNESSEYPFALINKKKKTMCNIQTKIETEIKQAPNKIMLYCVPVANICDNNSTTNELQEIFKFYNYEEVVKPIDDDDSMQKSIDELVAYIEMIS